MKRPTQIASTLLVLIIMIILLFPIFWMIVTSLKDNMAIYRIPPQWLPLSPQFSNYGEIFQTNFFLRYFSNNFIVSIGATLLTMLASVLAGYSFSRFPNRLSRFFSFSLLSTQMFPIIGIIIALYIFFQGLGLLNTRTALVLAISAMSIPFCTILIKGFFDDIPRSLEESARIDGAGHMRILMQIVMPLTKPGLLSIGLYTFMVAWDDFLYAITLIVSDKNRTLSAGIALRYLGEVSYDWAQVTTVSVIGTIPMFLLIFFFQKYMVKGLTAGAVKG
jgi:multiple sugar transport system permease protein